MDSASCCRHRERVSRPIRWIEDAVNVRPNARALATSCLLSLVVTTALAEPPTRDRGAEGDEPVREIFVPFEDLNVILDSDKHRVFLTRAEYNALVKAAKTSPQTPAPQKIVLSAAEYEGSLDDGRALVFGKLTIEVLEPGLYALPLNLRGVGIREAVLDGEPAPLSLDAQQQTFVLVQGVGLHTLELKLVAPLHTDAAQQTLQIALPTHAATRLKLTIAGNVEVKGGAAVISRSFDSKGNRTKLELVPQHGEMAIALSLNNRLQQEQAVYVARSVIVDEVTQGYERIHATVSYRVLHGAIQKLELAIPTGFEVTRVESPLLARWEVAEDGGAKALHATLRELTSDQIVLRIMANRSPAVGQDWLQALAEWTFPRIVPLGTAGQVAVVGLLVEDRLQIENVSANGLVPIDSAPLTGAIPASVLEAEPGAPAIRQVVSYFAPSSNYSLRARFVRPPAELTVAANSLLVISDQRLTLQGGFALTPKAEAVFHASFTVPPGWQVTQVTGADATPLSFERYTSAEGGARIVVRLAKGIEVNQTQMINFQAVHTPTGWLDDWQSRQVPFPPVLLENATETRGAIAVQAMDDLTVRPDEITGLTPLLDNEKAAFGLAQFPTALAYRYDAPDFAAALIVERTRPSLVAQAFSFFKLQPGIRTAHYELHCDVREARTRTLVFSIDKGTPAELAIRGLGDTVVKEYAKSDDGPFRRWTVRLAERQIGAVRIAVDFEQRFGENGMERLPLPLIQAEDVEYQSALVALEGHPELDVSLSTTARTVDVGELAAAEYLPGKRLIGAFGYVGSRPQMTIAIERRESYGLPPALVERAELLTHVAAAGRAQTVARYDLMTKATLLEIRLPPEATLWTIYLDDRPTKPQREGASLLLSLPSQRKVTVRKLQIVFETPASRLGMSRSINAIAPQLFVWAAGRDEQREVPQADLQWQLVLPSGYTVGEVGGTVLTEEVTERELAAIKVARLLYRVAGGIKPWSLARQAAREQSSSNTLRQPSSEALATPAALPDQVADMPATAESPQGVLSPAAEPAPPNSAELANSDAATRAEDAATSAAGFAPRASRPDTRLSRDVGSQQQAAFQNATELTVPIEDAAGDGLERGEGRFWALEGVSSLKIDLAVGDARATTFRSLGHDPRLEVTVIDERRLAAAAWGLALLVFLVGVSLSRRPAREQTAYVVSVLVGSTLPLLLSTRFDEVSRVLDYVFFAGCALVPWYVAAALMQKFVGWARQRVVAHAGSPMAQLAAIAIGASLVIACTRASAQHHEHVAHEDKAPVSVPADAIIVPYDPEKPLAAGNEQKILVPYARYAELWNAAYPDKPLDRTSPPVGYAIAGAAYEATLAASDYLALVGRMQIEVYSDKPVVVPLHLSGGVLEKALVDGLPARLQVAEPEKASQATQQAQLSSLPPRLLLLHLTGKGRKSVELHVRLGLARQGGWRIVRGQLPVGAAAALTLHVPQSGTQIRQSHLADRAELETQTDDERIDTALAARGELELRWRPKVAEGIVDQALTANAIAVLDVREDAVRLVWQVQLDFGRASRDAFAFLVPADYLVEQVIGDNIRGWQAKLAVPDNTTGKQRVEVTLLKPVTGSETLTLHIARRGRVGQGELAQFESPAVLVEDAALEQGVIAVRRSPRLELRAIATTGLARAERDRRLEVVEQFADATDAAVLRVLPFQTYRFVRQPFRLALAASEAPQRVTADVRAALRVAERDTTLDAAVTFQPQGQPLYRVRMSLPEGFELDRIGPGEIEWAVTEDNGRPLLTVHLLDGRSAPFAITLLGKLPPPPAAAQAPGAQPGDGGVQVRRLAVPKLEVLDVTKQEGEILILPDPDTDVRIENVANAEAAPLTVGPDWMKAEQQPLAKAVLRYRTPQYAATLTLSPRLPLVRAQTISNVKITPQAIEETLLVNFRIEQAGIRHISLLVPQHLARGRLKALLLKQKTITQAADAAGAPIPGMVRIALELQDYVRGDYAVLLEHDRILVADEQNVLLPIVETGITDRRLLAIENAGRDEIVVGDVVGLEPVNRQEQAWRELTAVLGENVTQAFVATSGSEQPKLTFSTLKRAEVQKAGARIGLATTLLVVDASGAYRGLVQYRVTNATEQFLEIHLPGGARLWTSLVAGEPVKPAIAIPPQGGVARIPLLKTAEGEGDYLVELKYGGQMSTGRSIRAVDFPLVRTGNIHVELSQVKLLLPESHRWFDFRGTMRHVEDDSELAALFQAYLGKRIQEAAQILSSTTSDYTKVRALVNLKQSQAMFQESQRSLAMNNLHQPGLALHNYEAANEALLEQAQQQVEQELAQPQEAAYDNRYRLNARFDRQEVLRSKNVVSDLASNFDAASSTGTSATTDSRAFNADWLAQNRLQSDLAKPGSNQPGKEGEERAALAKDAVRYFRSGGRTTADDAVAGEPWATQLAGKSAQKAPEIADAKQIDELQRKLTAETEKLEAARESAERGDQLLRYQQNLERQAEGFGVVDGAQRMGSGRPLQGGQSGSEELGSFGGSLQPPMGQPAAPETAGGLYGLPTVSGALDPNAGPQAALPVDGESLSQLAAGLASLDVRLPERGRLYRFTTPRGDIAIQARSVPWTLIHKLQGLALVGLAIGAVGVVGRPWVRRMWTRLFQSLPFAVAIALLGLASIIGGTLPLAGMLLIGVGVAIAIRSRMSVHDAG